MPKCIVIPYFATGILCTLIITVIVTMITTLLVSKIFFELLQKRKKKAINPAKQSSSSLTPYTTPQITKEPIYDDIELTNKTSMLDVSKNIAYGCSKN